MRPYRKVVNKQLGELLIDLGIISHKHLEEALTYQKEHGTLLGASLIAMGYATEENIAQALTCQYGFPFLPLSNYEIAAEVIATLPGNICRKFCLIPIDKIGKSLTLAMANPLNFQAVEDVELVTGCAVQAFVSTSTDINVALDRYYGKA